MNAQIFLSCGQNLEYDEPRFVHLIEEKIKSLGFDCYVAAHKQSSRSIRENIFKQLEESEYFLFIDFKREELKAASSEAFYRGSVFSNQELALASFVDFGDDILLFQEAGVEIRGGMLNAIQGNVEQFVNRDALPDRIYELIKTKRDKKEWPNLTKNQLKLKVPSPAFCDARQTNNTILRHFFIQVLNNHHRKVALNCYAYLDTVLNLDSGQKTQTETIEFKWSGYTLPNARIGPNSSRRFDAFQFPLQQPDEIQFKVFTDSLEYYPCRFVNGPGRYQLTFSVVSDNFLTARQDFK